MSPYNIAMIYQGLGEREATLAWLERGYEQREPRMVFLKAEPKWASLRERPEVPGVTAARRLHTLTYVKARIVVTSM